MPPGLADGTLARRITFTTPLSGRMGPKQAACIEEFRLVSRTATSFHVSMSATTPNVRCRRTRPDPSPPSPPRPSFSVSHLRGYTGSPLRR